MCRSKRAKSLAREFGLKMVGFGEALGSINSYFKACAGLADESTTTIQYFSKLTGTTIGTSGAALRLYKAVKLWSARMVYVLVYLALT
jgi:hypothetical protein